MQATNMLAPLRLRAALLTACLSFGALHAGDPLEGIPKRSIVKVLLKHESAGILHEGRFIPEVRVLEIHEFNGVVFDSRGFILSYVGTKWPKMRLPGSRFLVELEDGKRFSAKLVGLDERISLAVLQSGVAANREAVLGHSLRQGRLRFVAPDGLGWGASTLHVVRVSDHPLLPERELRTCGHESESREFASPGSLVFDPGGRFVGFVTDAGKSVFEQKIRSYRIVPIQILQRSAGGIIRQGDQQRAGWLGVMLDPEAAEIRIHSVIAKSPAAAAGLLPGDVITRVNDVELQDKTVFARSLQWAGADKRVRL
ncbi:MAG TPA: S1C family serine protease, partial [Acidobacteriota bacterium]|nr:S1C family serine protease [Acidobacteriota bacterium]